VCTHCDVLVACLLLFPPPLFFVALLVGVSIVSCSSHSSAVFFIKVFFFVPVCVRVFLLCCVVYLSVNIQLRILGQCLFSHIDRIQWLFDQSATNYPLLYYDKHYLYVLYKPGSSQLVALRVCPVYTLMAALVVSYPPKNTAPPNPIHRTRGPTPENKRAIPPS